MPPTCAGTHRHSHRPSVHQSPQARAAHPIASWPVVKNGRRRAWGTTVSSERHVDTLPRLARSGDMPSFAFLTRAAAPARPTPTHECPHITNAPTPSTQLSCAANRPCLGFTSCGLYHGRSSSFPPSDAGFPLLCFGNYGWALGGCEATAAPNLDLVQEQDTQIPQCPTLASAEMKYRLNNARWHRSTSCGSGVDLARGTAPTIGHSNAPLHQHYLTPQGNSADNCT